MRCFSCGGETLVLKVEPQDFNKVRGFDLNTVKCKKCGLVEKRLTFNRGQTRPATKGPSLQPGDPAPSIEAVLGKIGTREGSNKVAVPNREKRSRRPVKVVESKSSANSKEYIAPNKSNLEWPGQPREIELPNAAVSLPFQTAIPALHADAIGFAASAGNNGSSFDDGIEHSAQNVMQLVETLKADVAEPPANAALDRASPSTNDEAPRDQQGSVAGEHPEPETKSDLFAGGAPVPSLSLDDEERKNRLRDMFSKVRAKIRRDP